MHNQEKRKLADGRDRREIRDDIIGRILAQDRNPQHGGTSAKQDGVAVRCGFRHHLAPNCGLGAGSVFHHYRLAKSLGERLRDDAGHGVRGPSGGKRHDDANGLRGILRSRWNADEAQNCYGGEDAHQLLHDFSSLQIASLPVYVKPRWSNTGLPDTCWVKANLLTRDSARLFRLESSQASRATPFDELLLQESTQLAGRRAGGFRSLLFKLSAYLRALQDEVHLAREPLHDILWRFRWCE